MATCDNCFAGLHHRCRGCGCTVCAARRKSSTKGRVYGKGSPPARPPKRTSRRDHAAEYAGRNRPAPTAAHKVCAGTGWRVTGDNDLTPCFCRTSTMRRNTA